MAGNVCEISYINSNPIEVTFPAFSEYLIDLGKLKIGEYVFECRADFVIEDGCYVTQTVTEIVAPLPYVFR